ncbi:MAG: cytochrome c2 [Gammaproteobacteria bacterium]|jgi:cytochrome c2
MKLVVVLGRRLTRLKTHFVKLLVLSIALGTGISVSAQTTTDTASSASAKILDPNAVMRARGCTACHIIPGIAEARGTMGPTLKGLGKRKRLVARTLSNTDKNMRRWLKNPKAVKSDTMMPNVGLSDEEIEVLVAHFHTL